MTKAKRRDNAGELWGIWSEIFLRATVNLTSSWHVVLLQEDESVVGDIRDSRRRSARVRRSGAADVRRAGADQFPLRPERAERAQLAAAVRDAERQAAPLVSPVTAAAARSTRDSEQTQSGADAVVAYVPVPGRGAVESRHLAEENRAPGGGQLGAQGAIRPQRVSNGATRKL